MVEYARRARYRDGFHVQRLLTPDKPEVIRFDVGWTSITFNAGHQIRVLVSSGAAPLYEPNHHQVRSRLVYVWGIASALHPLLIEVSA